jgi:hypothetical protein
MGGTVTITPDAAPAAAAPVTITPDAAPIQSPSGLWAKANQYAGKALGAVGLPTSISDIPNWAQHMVGMAPDSKPFWQPIHDAVSNPTQENIVNAVPVFGPAAVAASRDVQNKDFLGAAIDAAAPTVMGAAAGEVGKAASARASAADQAAAAQKPIKAASDFNSGLPASKSAPYTPADYAAAKPYLDAEHADTPIKTVEDLQSASDSAIGKIEDRLQAAIKKNPGTILDANPLDDVKAVLSKNARGQTFVDAGVKELEDFKLDQPLTLDRADAIRSQLNAENKATLKKNNYDVATARKADPAFAAREAAAESLRNGIYDQLEAQGMPEARQLRQDEGSLIKIRNAAQNQIFNGDKIVASQAAPHPAAAIAAKAAPSIGASIGGGVGGGPGAFIGERAGEAAAKMLLPERLTRNAFIERSFSGQVTQ